MYGTRPRPPHPHTHTMRHSATAPGCILWPRHRDRNALKNVCRPSRLQHLNARSGSPGTHSTSTTGGSLSGFVASAGTVGCVARQATSRASRCTGARHVRLTCTPPGYGWGARTPSPACGPPRCARASLLSCEKRKMTHKHHKQLHAPTAFLIAPVLEKGEFLTACFLFALRGDNKDDSLGLRKRPIVSTTLHEHNKVSSRCLFLLLPLALPFA